MAPTLWNVSVTGPGEDQAAVVLVVSDDEATVVPHAIKIAAAAWECKLQQIVVVSMGGIPLQFVASAPSGKAWQVDIRITPAKQLKGV